MLVGLTHVIAKRQSLLLNVEKHGTLTFLTMTLCFPELPIALVIYILCSLENLMHVVNIESAFQERLI